ncbi:MAG: coproporphyrinogen dehydrogenase HemZ, partial [Clostridia bacterium]|nr:coproporphyrinogen dehydrogenase HemZ [Clostridia bacterium]
IIGRKHTAQDILEKYELVKSFGFSINMDFIAGLPNETFSDFESSINKAIQLNPDNITVHTLCLKKGSTLKEKVKRLSVDEISKMIDFSHQVLKQNGYNPYYLYRQKYMAGNLENTGYSKRGKECIYNIDVMEETSQNIAFGANAVSKAVFACENRIERYGTPKDVTTYVNKIEKIIKDKEKLFYDL